MCSYGAVDRVLGGLAQLLKRHDDAVRHLEAAIQRNAALGGASIPSGTWRGSAARTRSGG